MSSSRIFVNGLPPSITETDFRKHFSSGGREITDTKLLSQKRIGYVGYKTPEIASKAVKYFDKSYIRLCKLSVQIAKPVSPSNVSCSILANWNVRFRTMIRIIATTHPNQQPPLFVVSTISYELAVKAMFRTSANELKGTRLIQNYKSISN